MEAKSAFGLTDLSLKQAKILSWWQPSSPMAGKTDVVLEGAIRSGKTMAASFSFILWAMTNFDGRNFTINGKTRDVAVRNVIHPLCEILDMGPDVFSYVIIPSSPGGYRIDIQAFKHQNSFYVFGGDNERSQDKIQGFTSAGNFFDEAPLMPISFINQARGRTSVDGATNWYTLNPVAPNHPFYADIVAQMEESGSMFYLHMTFEDNPSLSEDTKARLRAMWPKNSVFYKRNVLGERVAAEGAIYQFDWQTMDQEGCPVVSKLPESFSIFGISVDSGYRNDFHALLWGMKDRVWYITKEFVWKGRSEGGRAASQYVEDLARLATWGGEEISSGRLKFVVSDPADLGFRTEVENSKHNNLRQIEAARNEVGPGIVTLMELLYSGKIKIFSGCPNTIRSLANLVWDEKAALAGVERQVKFDDHGADAARYGAMEAEWYTRAA